MTDKTPAPLSDTREPQSPKWEQFERERLSRRAALKKFGMTSGMAFFAMFAADDLARMVIKQMEQHQATRQVAETVAHEFKNAGIAFADDSGLPPCDSTTYAHNWNCCHRFNQAIADDIVESGNCASDPTTTAAECQAAHDARVTKAGNDLMNCKTDPQCQCTSE